MCVAVTRKRKHRQGLLDKRYAVKKTRVPKGLTGRAKLRYLQTWRVDLAK